MITKENLLQVVESNRRLLPSVLSKVEETREISLLFRYKPVEVIKHYLMQTANVILFPSSFPNYGGMVTYRNHRFYIHINTAQPRVYENFVWVHEYYHFKYEQSKIKNAAIQTFFEDSVLNEHERQANLFAAELLVDGRLLSDLFQQVTRTLRDRPLVDRVLHLMPVFEVPYKVIVIKLLQDGLLSEDDALNLIDHEYREQLPDDFDHSILQPTLVIKLDDLNEMLRDPSVISGLRESDLASIRNRASTLQDRIREERAQYD
ncbi:ImmA/IrrE family metallo-endopeptidase [Exiguobacterium sp. SH5S13]|uniref:ImmA/IrrE family metallo-endopeptidase n=1 Tax=unclassified Exiguobacterium TaxID=2644629 RepID=UPI001038DFC6|nr:MULTISPECIES: ImmA/IrrE family metallo-endopeptidase [unclassified Exiguobacterium]TCI24328.1 ImmA/IrrE family metallo-endopeptidase [Exiguobacterium sp. SH5S4]TCI53432.1 ImmA/IrrE family metallo-endopeptidase [Exiguobacterium sp. SH5S13]